MTYSSLVLAMPERRCVFGSLAEGKLMEKFAALSPQRLFFDLASRLGSLEGYPYAEEKVEKKYRPMGLYLEEDGRLCECRNHR